MRRLYKILLACGLAAIPVVWVSAQQMPSRQETPRRFDFSNPPPARDSFAQPGQSDANRSSGNATTSVSFTAQPLPKEFAILDTRSIFSKDHLAISASRGRPVFSGTQSNLFFRGIMKEGDRYLANIEDNSSHATQWVAIGEMLTFNGARITEINFDHIVVDRGGTARQIGVGERLDGGKSVPQPGPTASAAPSAKAAATASAADTGAAAEGSILESMKARRLKELGQ
jgi:hypothetical protein